MAAGIVSTLCAGVLALWLTFLIRRRAEARREPVVDGEEAVPAPVAPARGGLAIVAGGTFAATILVWMLPGWAFTVAMLGLAIAFVGYLDDLKPSPAWLRLTAHFVFGSVLVWALGPATLAPAIAGDLSIYLVIPLLILGAVVAIDAFRAIDAVEGLAGTQVIFMFGAAIWLALESGAPMTAEFWWIAAIGAATLCFLVVSWPSANVLMGEAGSTYLGFMLAFAALATIAIGALSLPQWLILAAPFLADRAVSMLRRGRGPVAWTLAEKLGAHLPVTAGVAAIDIVVLLPLAWWAAAQPESAWIGALCAYAPLLALALFAGAGAREPKRT